MVQFDNLRSENQLCFPLYACSKEKAKDIPPKLKRCINLDKEETIDLYRLLYKVLSNFLKNLKEFLESRNL